MGCPNGCSGSSATNIKANVTNSLPKQEKGIKLGGSQISNLPAPKVTIKKY